MALSTIILDAKFAPTISYYLLPLVYILTTPSGIAIGIAINSAFNSNRYLNFLFRLALVKTKELSGRELIINSDPNLLELIISLQ